MTEKKNIPSALAYLFLFLFTVFECVAIAICVPLLRNSCSSLKLSISLPAWLISSATVGILVNLVVLVCYFRPVCRERGADPMGLGFLRNTAILWTIIIVPLLFRLVWFVFGLLLLATVANCEDFVSAAVLPLSIVELVLYPLALTCKILLACLETPRIQ